MSKKILKKAVIGLMAAAMMMTVTGGVAPKTASAAAKKSGDYRYVIKANGVKITKYTGKAEKVTIPAKIAGKKVVTIGHWAFRNNSKIKQVKIPDNVNKIDFSAFEGCNKLKKVTLPKKLKKIESDAFEGTAITTITIPDGVKRINYSAFRNCKNLKKVTLGDNVKIIDMLAFDNCEKLKTINLEKVEKIKGCAFRNNKSLAGKLDLKNVTEIEAEAFSRCSSIKSVEFSDSLQKLGECETERMEVLASPQDMVSGVSCSNPFAYCSNIESFSVDTNNANFTSVDGIIYGKTKQWIVAYPGKKKENVVIDDNIKGIAEYAFSGAQIDKVTMGKGLNTIRSMAFAESTVTEVKMPINDVVMSVVWKPTAFMNCKSLKKVVFPEGLSQPNGVAFYNCTSLTDVVLPKSMQYLSNAMFMGCTSLETVVLPENIKTIPAQSFHKCSSLKNINLDNISFVGNLAFAGCKALKGVLNLNITGYGTGAFADCTGITEVNFNKPLETLAGISFDLKNCNGVAANIIGEDGAALSEEDYGYDNEPYALSANPFAGCTSLKSINTTAEGPLKSVDGVLFTSDMKFILSFPAGITGKYTIPDGVEEIHYGAFAGTKVSEVICSDSIVEIDRGVFRNSKVKSVTISKSVKEIYDAQSVFMGCSKLEKIEVDADNEKYESLDGMLLFKNENNKRLIAYPSGKKDKVIKLDKNIFPNALVFKDCKYLKKVYLKSLDTSSADESFRLFVNCKNIKLYLPKDFVPSLIDDDLRNFTRDYYSFTFDDVERVIVYDEIIAEPTCTGCKTYVKKGSKLAKKLDKYKIKYYKY